MHTRFFLVVAIAAIGCSKADKATPRPYASDTLPVDAIERSGAICNRLVAAGVARSCVNAHEQPPNKLHSPLVYPSTFEPVGGFAKERCFAHVFAGLKEFNDLGGVATSAPADDYPRSIVASTDAAMWHAVVACEGAEGDRWDACRAKKSVAECAKAFPPEYAKHKARHDAAVRIVDGR